VQRIQPGSATSPFISFPSQLQWLLKIV